MRPRSAPPATRTAVRTTTRTTTAARTTAALAAVVLCATGCASDPAGPAGTDGYPTTVQNCGRPVTISRKPERVVALGPSEVTTLYAAGGVPKLVGRDDAGTKSDPYPADLRAAVAGVPQLGSGGEVTRENVIAMAPDLVVGSVSETVTPDTLGAVGIPMISLSGNCGSNHAPGIGDGTSDFDDVVTDMTLFGRLLDTQGQADAAVARLRERVARVGAPAGSRGGSAAAAIVFRNGLEVYGRRSMAHTQFTALGLRDVFGDIDSRVFEANIEELISRNPDTLVLLSYGDTDAEARAKFLAIPGAANLAAVRNDAVFVQPYEFSSQGALSIDGLENIARHLSNPR